MIKLEKAELPFQKSGLRVLLKSKVQTFDNGSLTVIKGWIDTDTYKKYYQNAKCVLVAFPQSYQYRVSATLIEAIRDKIPIIGADIQLIKYYNSIFPNICSIYRESSFVDDVLHSLVRSKEQENEFSKFIETHSDEYIAGIIKHDLLQLMNNTI